jgi:LmbE family N-acetylglucosaminyl deacetylase
VISACCVVRQSLLDHQRVLAVSPHLDDAVFSAGATLAALAGRGATVDVLTPFAGPSGSHLSRVAMQLHATYGDGRFRRRVPYGSKRVPARRRREDLDAMALLGATAQHGRFPDAVYRKRTDGSWLIQSLTDLFEPSLPPEPALETELVADLELHVQRQQPTLVMTCAAAGGHVDHRYVRDGVLVVASRHDFDLVLWEDLPYAFDKEPTPPSPELHLLPVALPKEAWAKKYACLQAYRSQLRMLWGAGDWRREFESHARARGDGGRVEALWVALPGDSADDRVGTAPAELRRRARRS